MTEEKEIDAVEWLFTFNFYESKYYSDEYLHRTVKLYAKSKEDAFEKLNKLVNCYNNLSWNCEEIRRNNK